MLSRRRALSGFREFVRSGGRARGRSGVHALGPSGVLTFGRLVVRTFGRIPFGSGFIKPFHNSEEKKVGVPDDSVLFLVSDAWVGLPYYSLLLLASCFRGGQVARCRAIGPKYPAVEMQRIQ
jgi:hypothetical protein